MPPAARDALQARYEELRAAALAVPTRRSRDLELFVAGGTVSWIRAWSKLPTLAISRREGPPDRARPPARAELAPVLADLALAAAREAQP